MMSYRAHFRMHFTLLVLYFPNFISVDLYKEKDMYAETLLDCEKIPIFST